MSCRSPNKWEKTLLSHSRQRVRSETHWAATRDTSMAATNYYFHYTLCDTSHSFLFWSIKIQKNIRVIPGAQGNVFNCRFCVTNTQKSRKCIHYQKHRKAKIPFKKDWNVQLFGFFAWEKLKHEIKINKNCHLSYFHLISFWSSKILFGGLIVVKCII